jgi:hypothetical protein
VAKNVVTGATVQRAPQEVSRRSRRTPNSRPSKKKTEHKLTEGGQGAGGPTSKDEKRVPTDADDTPEPDPKKNKTDEKRVPTEADDTPAPDNTKNKTDEKRVPTDADDTPEPDTEKNKTDEDQGWKRDPWQGDGKQWHRKSWPQGSKDWGNSWKDRGRQRGNDWGDSWKDCGGQRGEGKYWNKKRQQEHWERNGGGRSKPGAERDDNKPPAKPEPTAAKGADHKGHYKTLGLDPPCSDKEVVTAYRQLSLKCHPDKLGQDAPESVRKSLGDLFVKAGAAKEVLTNSAAREQYDAECWGELPTGWSKHNSRDTGRYYYFAHGPTLKTGQAVFERPTAAPVF